MKTNQQQDTDTKIVRQTNFEKLLQTAQQERELELAKEQKRTLLVWKQRELSETEKKLINHIISVYFFIRTEVKLPVRPITREEFEAAESKLEEIARQKTARLVNILTYLVLPLWYFETTWSFYLKNGYFRNHDKPFGIKIEDVLIARDGGRRVYDWELHDDITKNETARIKAWSRAYNQAIPPNLAELYHELFNARYRHLKEELLVLETT